MLRVVEILFFLAPFALFAARVFLGKRASAQAMWTIVGGLLLLAAATVWYGLERSLPRDDTYVPAHIENGRIVQGHGVPP